MPVFDLKDELSAFQNLKSPFAWTGRFRGSPAKWKATDGEAVLKALQDAKKNPVERPVDQAKLARRPKGMKAKIGSVSIPEEEDAETETRKEINEHTEMQWFLLHLGSDMGFDVWVARNDRKKAIQDKKFLDIPHLKSELPLQFDEVTNRTIELIDVLWLKGNAIVAAFEIESTTSIYSGLLRMSDLITMQPNLNIPLYLVAPDERRNKVITEINRPTFSHLSPPMKDMCRYISFNTLRHRVSSLSAVLRYLKPDFLEDISEACELEI